MNAMKLVLEEVLRGCFFIALLEEVTSLATS